MSEGLKFDRKLINIGTKEVKGVTMPPQVVEYLGVDVGDKLVMMVDKGKHGNFISLWKKPEEDEMEGICKSCKKSLPEGWEDNELCPECE